VVETLAESVSQELSVAGLDVLLDDRDARPGEKFADADLLGCPLRITVGKKSLDDGAVDVRRRSDEVDARVDRSSVIDWTTHD
jgi:prolyl-tRNA synthetase